MFEVLAVFDAPPPQRGEVHVVLSGEVDIATTWQLPEQVWVALPGPATTVRVDASRVTFIDTYAISVVMVLRARLRAPGHDLTLIARSRAVARVLQVLDLVAELGPTTALTS